MSAKWYFNGAALINYAVVLNIVWWRFVKNCLDPRSSCIEKDEIAVNTVTVNESIQSNLHHRNIYDIMMHVLLYTSVS
jgi:membrane protein implicated in regulation of membrane protease activity